MLIGAILAPTDPVLASLVQVNNSRDSDHVRYGLSGEAGFNDGTAFPFVVFGLLLIEQGSLSSGWVGDWALHRLLWAVPAGLSFGYLLGRLIGKLAIYLRARHADTSMSPNDSSPGADRAGLRRRRADRCPGLSRCSPRASACAMRKATPPTNRKRPPKS